MRLRRGFRSALLIEWAAIALAGIPCAAAPENPPERAENLRYNPDIGQWEKEAPPVPGTPAGDLALARRLAAREEYDQAHRALRKWFKAYPEDYGPEYPHALLLHARVRIARRDYAKAHQLLQRVLNEYAERGLVEEAIAYELIVAEVFLSGTKRKVWNMRLASGEEMAMEILDNLAVNFPEYDAAQYAVRTKGDYYFREGEFDLAEIAYARLGNEFPRGRFVRYALRRSADAALGSFAGIEFDDAALIEAEERFNDYLQLYPGSAEQEGVGLVLENIRSQRAAKEFSIGQYYERTGQHRAAAFYYRSTSQHWPGTIAANRAAARVAVLAPEAAPVEGVGSESDDPAEEETP